MWNEYEITYSDAVKLKDDDFLDKSEMRQTIARLKKDIKALGDVNVNAIEEFKEINERYVFMNEQHEDIMKAKDNLLNIINELETGMRKQFKEKFAEIQTEFDKVFVSFLVDMADCCDSEDILDAGINIISQPRKEAQYDASGGERLLLQSVFFNSELKAITFCL